jgi:hypothetical protein
MIKIEWRGEHNILIITPEGRLEAKDFVRLAQEVDPYLEEHGQLKGLLIQAESFPGWQDFAALLSHLRFVKSHHEQVRKVAAVTDSGFLSILPQVANHFIKAEIRHFSLHDKQSALAWIEGAQPT